MARDATKHYENSAATAGAAAVSVEYEGETSHQLKRSKNSWSSPVLLHSDKVVPLSERGAGIFLFNIFNSQLQ